MKKHRNYEVIVDSYVTSPDFDPRFSRDGGCYEQPTIEGRITWEGCRKPINFTVEDKSCGDFGRKYGVYFTDGPKEMCGHYETNELDFNGEIPDESNFELNRAIMAIRELFEKETGFWFYTKEELAS